MEKGKSTLLVSVARTDLELAVRALEADPSSTSLQSHTVEKRRELKEVIRKEDDLKRRSKTNWLRIGDSNTRFFSIATKIRRSKNSTLRIFNQEGRTVTRAQLESSCFSGSGGLLNNH